MSKYWTIVLPLAVCSVIYYAYSSGGYFSRGIQYLIDPLLKIVKSIANAIFGV